MVYCDDSSSDDSITLARSEVDFGNTGLDPRVVRAGTSSRNLKHSRDRSEP